MYISVAIIYNLFCIKIMKPNQFDEWNLNETWKLKEWLLLKFYETYSMKKIRRMNN